MIPKVKKAVILAAGIGTRFLPITKTFPKETLPLIDKPIIQYLVEESVLSGIREIALVISPEKSIIKDYFQSNKKLEYFLKIRKKKKYLAEIKKINRLAKISYYYQKKPLGIGDAILSAKKQINNEPFALFFADDVIASKVPCLKQMLKVYQKYQATVLATCQVPFKEVRHYGIVKIKKIQKRIYQVLDLIEKPSIKEVRPWSDSDPTEVGFRKDRNSGRSPSNFAIVGRYILGPEIIPALEKIRSKKLKPGQEIYLTDALKILLERKFPIYAYEYEGKWLSCGHKFDWLKANIEMGLKHPEVKKDLKKYLKQLTTII